MKPKLYRKTYLLTIILGHDWIQSYWSNQIVLKVKEGLNNTLSNSLKPSKMDHSSKPISIYITKQWISQHTIEMHSKEIITAGDNLKTRKFSYSFLENSFSKSSLFLISPCHQEATKVKSQIRWKNTILVLWIQGM